MLGHTAKGVEVRADAEALGRILIGEVIVEWKLMRRVVGDKDNDQSAKDDDPENRSLTNHKGTG